MQNDSLVPKHPVLAIKEASKLRNLGNQFKRVGDFTKNIFYDQGKFNPLVGIPKAIKRGYESTAAATSPTKQKNMIADALENMRSGKAVDDVVTNPNQSKGLIGALRNRGFLSVGRKTTGRYTDAQTSQINEFLKQKGVLQADSAGNFRVNQKLSQAELQKALTEARSTFKADPNALTRGDKIKDFAYNVLPGEKTLVVGGAGLGAAGELSSKQTAEGRQKSLAERIGRAGTIGAVETIAAPLGIARRFGTLGFLGETGAAMVPSIAMTAADKAIGNPAMRKQAGAFEDLTPAQKALVTYRLERGGGFGYKTPNHLKISLKDSVNPFKLNDNYQKHRKRRMLMLDHIANEMYSSKEAAIPSRPRSTIRRAIK